MYIQGIRADEVTAEDIKRLVDNKVPENKSLDYKRELPGLDKDDGKKEFLYDISAMYNTEGGCIIYGIAERKDENKQNTGEPEKITGIEVVNRDKLKQKIENIVSSGTEPSISQLLIRYLEIDSQVILIIGISKGLGLPTMVIFKHSNKFYKRRNSGKFAVDVYELNQMFMQNQVLLEKANRFREERINKVLSQDAIPNLEIDSVQ